MWELPTRTNAVKCLKYPVGESNSYLQVENLLS